MAVGLSALRVGRPLPPGRFLIFLLEAESTPDHSAADRIRSIEKPMTSGIEPATFIYKRLTHPLVTERVQAKKISCRDTQGTWSQEELISGNPPVLK
jgi:hypothetical protein